MKRSAMHLEALDAPLGAVRVVVRAAGSFSASMTATATTGGRTAAPTSAFCRHFA